MNQNRALLVVDVQIDFVDGTLAVTGGDLVAQRITDYLAAHAGEYALVIASRDWHDPHGTNSGHFPADGDQPDYVDTWPVHCVAGTPGADYHPALKLPENTIHVFKGQGIPAYSMFEGATDDGQTVRDLLAALGDPDIDVVGIATDYCVFQSARDAADVGLGRVRVLTDLTAGVAANSTARALTELTRLGVNLDTAQEG